MRALVGAILAPDPKGGIVNTNMCNDANVPVMTDSSSNVVHK